MSKTIFEEKQRFNNPLVWIGMGVAFIVVFYQTFLAENDTSLNRQLISFGLFLLVFVFLFIIQLNTRIDEHGIHVHFFPFLFKRKSFSWSDIYSAEAVKYSPLGDYGGWGYRISFRGKGRAYSTRGDKGIKVVLKDGKTRMIGTQKMDEANACLQQYIEKKA